MEKPEPNIATPPPVAPPVQILPRRVYYAHPLETYGSGIERTDTATLLALGLNVFNPNNTVSEVLYLRRKDFNVFLEMVAQCDALAFRAHPDGGIPAGVAKEVAYAMAIQLPIIELPCGITRRSLTVEETREWLREVGQG